jgi:NADH pyrophosphatase NudC (nudix superfamily)
MSEKKISKNVCPHCGSKNVTVDVDVRIRCHIEDGQIMLNDEYLDRSGRELARAVSESGWEDYGGFCGDCGNYFDVDHVDDSGVYFTPCEGLGRVIDKKYKD